MLTVLCLSSSLPSEPLVTALVKGILTTLDLRSTLLLPPLLDATKAYFTTQQTSLFALPAAEYISHVSALLRAEETRMSTVFGLDARAGGIVEAVEDVMLRSCGTELIKRGIAELMIGGKATEAEVGTAAALEDAEDDEGEGDKGKEKTSGKTKGSVPNEEGLKHLITLLRSVGLEAGLKPVWSDWIKVSERSLMPLRLLWLADRVLHQNHVETLISDPQKGGPLAPSEGFSNFLTNPFLSRQFDGRLSSHLPRPDRLNPFWRVRSPRTFGLAGSRPCPCRSRSRSLYERHDQAQEQAR